MDDTKLHHSRGDTKQLEMNTIGRLKLPNSCLHTNSSKQAHDQQDDDAPEHVYIHLPLQFTALVTWTVVVQHGFGLVTCRVTRRVSQRWDQLRGSRGVISGADLHRWQFPRPPPCCGWCSLAAAGSLCKARLSCRFDGFCQVRGGVRMTAKGSQLHSSEKYWEKQNYRSKHNIDFYRRAPRSINHSYPRTSPEESAQIPSDTGAVTKQHPPPTLKLKVILWGRCWAFNVSINPITKSRITSTLV